MTIIKLGGGLVGKVRQVIQRVTRFIGVVEGERFPSLDGIYESGKWRLSEGRKPGRGVAYSLVMTAVEVSLGWVLLSRKISRPTPPLPPPSVEFREKSIIDDDLLRPRDIFLEKGGGIPGYLDSYLQIEGRLREKFWRRFMHGSCTFLHRPPLLIQRPRRCAERAGSREENQAGANKSGEINKTFPEGCFLFILAASFRPPTNFSCWSHGLRVNIWPGRSSLKKDANLGESVEGNSTANFHDQIPRKMDTPE